MFSSKLSQKMWESLADKGIGTLLRPWVIEREGLASAKADRHKKLIEAQTEIDVEKIKKGEAFIDVENAPREMKNFLPVLNNSSVGRVDPVIDVKHLATSISESVILERIEEEVNVSKSIMQADVVLSEDNSQPEEKEINKDWLIRWRDNAAKTSSDEIQQIWGKILAGEIKKPGSFSLRTIEFIRNLSQDEAASIEKMYRFVFAGRIIKEDEEGSFSSSTDKDGILTYDYILKMQSLGLISGAESLGLTTTYKTAIENKFVRAFTYNKNKKIITFEDENESKKLVFNVYILTPTGLEVSALCEQELDIGYINMIIKKAKEQGFTVKVSDIILTDGRYSAYNTVIV